MTRVEQAARQARIVAAIVGGETAAAVAAREGMKRASVIALLTRARPGHFPASRADRSRAAWNNDERRVRTVAAFKRTLAAKRAALFAGPMDAACDEMLATGRGLAAIAERVGASVCMLRARLQDRGIPLPTRRRRS